MAKCDLRIELDRAAAAYRPGDEVRGAVVVAVDADVRCRLSAWLEWETHGRGNRTSAKLGENDLFEGEWTAGEERRYPFTLRCPNGPFTYRGHYLNVDWTVKARADIPWAIDPKAEQGIELQSGPSDDPIDRGPSFEVEASKRGRVFARGCFVLFFLPFFIGGLVTTGAGVAHYTDHTTVEGDAWVAFIVGPVFMLVGLIPFFVWLHGALVRRRTGAVDAQVSRRELKRGDELTASLAFEPRGDYAINAIRARLVAEEVVVRGSGTNRTTHRHVAFEDAKVLAEDSFTRRHDPIRLQTDFRVPDEAPLSFGASDNRLDWYVELTIDIPGWPDWRERVPLVVDP